MDTPPRRHAVGFISVTWIKLFRPVRLALDVLSLKDTSGRFTARGPLGAGLDAPREFGYDGEAQLVSSSSRRRCACAGATGIRLNRTIAARV